MSAAPSISIGEISGSEPETCCNWVQSQAEDCDQKSIPSSAKLCEEMAGVMVSVRQMAAENRTTRIRKVRFRAGDPTCCDFVACFLDNYNCISCELSLEVCGV